MNRLLLLVTVAMVVVGILAVDAVMRGIMM